MSRQALDRSLLSIRFSAASIRACQKPMSIPRLHRDGGRQLSRSGREGHAPDHVPLKEVPPRVGERHLGKCPAARHSRVVRLDNVRVYVRPEISLIANNPANETGINGLLPPRGPCARMMSTVRWPTAIQ